MPKGAVTVAWLPKIDWTASAVPPMPRPVSPRPAIIGLAFNLSMTNQRSTEASTQAMMAMRMAAPTDFVSMMPRIVAQAPMIIRPSRPRFQTPARCAITPASVT